MSRINKKIVKLASSIEDRWDDLIFRIKVRLRLNDPIQIVTYRSYGAADRLYVKGRVLEDKGIMKGSVNDSLLNNLLNMYKRFESDEVPHARLKIVFQQQEHYVTTDQEGYFVLNLTPKIPLNGEDIWHEVKIELVNSSLSFSAGITALAEVLVPSNESEYGIISDIDDTIVKTTATSLLAMSRNTFFNNAHTRLPFAGVSEFYRALQSGRNGKRNNPFFYVSSSPWNLYDLLIDFLDLNNIPEGPLLLRDFGLDHNKAGSSDHMGHKFKEIENILTTYPHLNFILIGDSGQDDPVIYKEVVKKYPNRILVIYIRDVQLSDRQQIAISVSNELTLDKVEMIIVDNTEEAANHAAKINLIYKDAIPSISKDKQQDKGEIPGKKELD